MYHSFHHLGLFVAILCISLTGITGYTVVGNKLYDPTGAKVIIKGVCRPSFEWNPNGQHVSLADYTLMRNQWGANAVRLSLNQDFWLSGSTYANTIDQQIAWIRSLGMGVILDLHWINGGQQKMADGNSITFWTSLAERYKNNPWVMFELYNEPQLISWDQWLNGDSASNFAGMQAMFDAVRATGAQNAVIIGGRDWAFDLSGVGSGYAVRGSNIIYATHPYDYSGKRIENWPTAFGYLAAHYPVIMTEFGQYCANNTYVADLLNYAEALGIHWTAWAWWVEGCAFPSIISDWNGTPYPGVGDTIKRYMTGSFPTANPASTHAPAVSATGAPQASGAMSVFANGLASGWEDWSWSTSYTLADTQFLRSGSRSIRFEAVKYEGVYFHATNNFAPSAYDRLVFFVNGGTSNKAASVAVVKVYGTDGKVTGNAVNFPVSLTANTWTQASISISSFGVPASALISGFVFQANVDASAGNVYIADVSFVPAGANPTSAPPVPRPPTSATQAPVTQAPTTRPPTSATQAPVTQAPTAKATSAPVTQPPASSGCDASSIRLVQTQVGASWESAGKTITQYKLEISNTCNRPLVGMTFTASNWSPINFWNAVQNGNTFSLPTWCSISSSDQPYVVGYQNTVGQAAFTITSVTFQ